jgi:hypothetical protein
MTKDSGKRTGIPELVLHPLAKRPQEDIISPESTEHEYNYEVIKEFNKKDSPKLMTFMDKHAKFNPETFFYTYTE